MPKFQQRHYEALAEVLQRQFPSQEKSQIVRDLAAMFACDNLSFNYGKWFRACDEPHVSYHEGGADGR